MDIIVIPPAEKVPWDTSITILACAMVPSAVIVVGSTIYSVPWFEFCVTILPMGCWTGFLTDSIHANVLGGTNWFPIIKLIFN